ncbi:autotransporter-associated beta strand repeat-containing protein [Thauera sinica]|nr:autotransporter-associated beta strand repeat-containing protein [Thauera sp. K11]
MPVLARAATIPTIGCNSTGYLFNTAYSGNPAGPPKTVGARDTYWEVSREMETSASFDPPTGGWDDGYVVSQVHPAWTVSPYGNADWISHSADAVVGGTPESPDGRRNYWYRYRFNLDGALDPSQFYMKLNFFADDGVGMVYVNGVEQPNSSYYDVENIGDPANQNYAPGSGAYLILDRNWQTGLNEILVRIVDRHSVSAFLVQYDGQSSTICTTTVTVNTVSQGGTGGFAYSGTNGVAAHDVITTSAGTAAAGARQTLAASNGQTTITQAVFGYELSAASCTGMADGATQTANLTNAAVGDLPARSVRFSDAGNGRDVTCTFTNNIIGDGGAHWDGTDTALPGNGSVQGGAGNWNAADTNWTAGNGTGNGKWVANGKAVFGVTGGAVEVSGTQAIGGLDFKVGGYSLTGGTLTGGLPTNVLSTGSGIGATIGSTLAGANAFEKAGAGSITLTGANTYSGGTTVSGGALIIGGAGTLYNTSGAGSITVNSGATLRFDRSDTFGLHIAAPASRVTIAGGTVASNNTFNTLNDLALNGGTLTANGGSHPYWGAFGLKGTVTSSGTSAFTVGTGSNNFILIGTNAAGGTTTFDVTGGTLGVATPLFDNRNAGSALVASNLAKSGAGTLTLSGANTYTGTTTVSAGTLAIGGSGTLYNTSGAGSITVNSGATLRFDRSDTFGVHTAVPASTITIAGGTVASNGTFNTLNDLTLSGGTLTANGGANADYGAFALKGTVTSAGTSAFTVGAGSNNFILIGTNAAGGTTTFDVTGGTLGVATPLSNNRSGGGATVASNLAKSGAGTLTLSAANTYTGTTTVSAGTLAVGTGGTTGSIASGSAISVASGATLEFYRSDLVMFGNVFSGSGTLNFLGTGTQGQSNYIPESPSPDFAGTIVVKNGARLERPERFGSAAVTVESGATALIWGGVDVPNGFTIAGNGWNDPQGYLGAIRFQGPGSTLSGNVAMSADSRIALHAANESGTISGAISGGFALEKFGPGTLTLSGANTYDGATTVSAGTLKLGADGTLPAATSATVASGATLNLDGKTQTLAGLASSGTLDLGTGGTLTISGDSSIGAVSGSGTIKVTGGTLTLGAGFTNTDVNIELAGGSLTLGAATYGIGTFTVTNSATLDMASGNASLTVASLAMTGSNTLTVTNWTAGSDHFYATAISTPTPAKDTPNIAPLNRITLGGSNAITTQWLTTGNELSIYTGPFTYWDGPAVNATTIEGGSGTWLAADISGNWTTASGGPNGPWTDGQVATFGGSATGAKTVTLNANQSIGGLTFLTDGYTINGIYTLTGTAAINYLQANPDVTATVGSVLAGTNAFEKAGNGTLILTGNNTYTGATTVSFGTLQVGNNTTTGSLAGDSAISIASGATLAYYSSSDSTGNALIGNTFAGAGTLRFKGNATQNQSSYTLSAPTHTLSGAVVVESGARLTRSNTGALGTAPITIESGGQLYLGGSSADMTSAVSIAGTGWNEAAGYIGALRVDGGATQSGNVTLTAASSIGTFAGSGTISGVISGGFALTKLRAGTTILTGNNTYTGATTVSAGTLQVGSGGTTGSIASGSAISIASGATLAFYNANWLRTIGNTISGAGTLRFKGTGTVEESAYIMNTANSLTGPTVIESGALVELHHGSGLGTSAITVNEGGGLYLRNGPTAANDVSLAGDGYAQTAGRIGALRLGGGATLTGNVTLTGNARLATYLSTDTGTISGAISGGFGIEKSHSGTLTLSGANTYTGATTVSAGTLKLGANGALPSASATTVASGATLNLDGKTQTLASLTSSGTLNLGTGGVLTITGDSSIGAVTGSGTIRVTGGTLTLGAGFSNTSVNIELAGGNLTLGANTYSIGTFTIADSATLDMASGTASLTAATLTLDSGKALTVSNWTRGSDVFKASAFTGATRNAVGAAPMNQIALAPYGGGLTVWRADDEIDVLLEPRLRIAKTSTGGTGSFGFQMTGLSASTDTIVTSVAGTPAPGAAGIEGTAGTAVTITEATVPAGWPANPAAASCVDANGTASGNGTGPFGTLSGKVLSIAASNLVAGADITCTFANTLNGIGGTVFNDGGAPSGGANTGTPNNGVQDGAEAGLAGLAVSLTDCAATPHASATTDSAGRYSLQVPPAAAGQPVCVSVAVPSARRATGASVAGTPTPDGTATSVGGVSYTYDRAGQRQAFTAPATGVLTLDFGVVPDSTLQSDSSKTGPGGGAAVHGHSFTAGTGGSVVFSTGAGTSTPAVGGWSEVVYADPDCTGTLQSGAARLYPPAVPQTVVQGQVVCVVMRQFVPEGVASGAANSVPVQAALTFTNAAPGLVATYTVTDTTTMSSGALTLQKRVRNVSTGGAFGTSNQARSGDTLEYEVIYTNTGAEPLTHMQISDGTPAYTTFVSAAADLPLPGGVTGCSLRSPANPPPAAAAPCSPAQTGTGKGLIGWHLDGSVNPGASGTVRYTVTVD